MNTFIFFKIHSRTTPRHFNVSYAHQGCMYLYSKNSNIVEQITN